MEFDQLRQLDAIDREGTLTAASERLRISQPALTRSMQRLERELGVRLLERQGRNVAFTAAGRLALDHARRLLRDERQMRDALDDHARRARALRVGAVAPAPLWRLTAQLIECTPQTILTSEFLGEREIERRVLDGTIDLGISLKPCVLPTVRCRQLMTESLSVSLPSEHPLAASTSLSAVDLDGETFLLYRGIGFWQGFCDEHFPHSEFVVQDDRAVFEQMLPVTPLAYFVTEVSARDLYLPGRAVIPLRDTAAHATYYLLALQTSRPEISALFG